MSKISPEVMGRLFDALTTDDEFRDAFASDARAALRSLGHETPARVLGVPGRDPVLPFLELRGGLASKEKIAAGRERLERGYNTATVTGVTGTIMAPFDLCAG